MLKQAMLARPGAKPFRNPFRPVCGRKIWLFRAGLLGRFRRMKIMCPSGYRRAGCRQAGSVRSETLSSRVGHAFARIFTDALIQAMFTADNSSPGWG